jgi:hypothetical protein
MHLSPNNDLYLAFLKDIYEVSEACQTVTYIWGGFTMDIVEGRFLREHHDLDGFTFDLLGLLPELIDQYEQRGYTTTFREDIHMLVIAREGLHAAFNRLDIDGEIAMWRHIGEEGTVYFPVTWLDAVPRDFYDTQAYTAGLQLDYTLKTNIRMIHATWELRDKDTAAIAHLEAALAARALDPEQFLRQVWSFNPFWAKRGFPAYAMPTVARSLHPLNPGPGDERP